MNGFELIVRFALAVTFAVGATAKLRQPKLAALALVDFGLTRSPDRRLGYLAGALELGVALLLVLAPTAKVGAIAIGALLWSFVFLLGRALRRGEEFACFCFGNADDGISRVTVLRTATLAVLATLLVASLLVSPEGASATEQAEAAIAAVALVGASLLAAKVPGLRKFNRTFMRPGESTL